MGAPDFMDELGLVDAYRALHPERKVFTGFVKGRFIGQNVGLLNDIIEYADAKKLPGNSQVSFYSLIFEKLLTLLSGILFPSVLNYTTSAQISGNGYPFFTTMLKVAC